MAHSGQTEVVHLHWAVVRRCDIHVTLQERDRERDKETACSEFILRPPKPIWVECHLLKLQRKHGHEPYREPLILGNARVLDMAAKRATAVVPPITAALTLRGVNMKRVLHIST